MKTHEHDAEQPSPSSETGDLGPREAAALLRESEFRARQSLAIWPPYLLFIGAAIFFVGFGAMWWSVRGQHPYVGPSGGALAVLYGGIVVWIAVVTAVVRRATSGVAGPTARTRAYRFWYVVVIIAYSLFQGALYHAGASASIVYGIFPASAPWLFAGTVVLTLGVVREDGRTLALGVMLIVLGVAAGFAGPVVAWLVSGIGIGVILCGGATLQLLQRRMKVSS